MVRRNFSARSIVRSSLARMDWRPCRSAISMYSVPDRMPRPNTVACWPYSFPQCSNADAPKDLARIYEDPRPSDIKHSHADITRAREHLGYQPKVTFEEGLRSTIEWYRNNLLGPRPVD